MLYSCSIKERAYVASASSAALRVAWLDDQPPAHRAISSEIFPPVAAALFLRPRRLLRQYLYFCTSNASKLSTCVCL